MIIIRLIGRLGNQLFQYSFALSEQKRLGTYAVIDDRDMKDIVSEYFDVRGIFQHRLIKRLAFKFARFPTVGQEGAEEPSEFFPANMVNSRYYIAYFQSELYFNAIKEEVKKRFQIKQRFIDEFRRKYGQVFDNNKVLAIHYRIGDYVNWTKEELGGTDFTLPEAYYRNALDRIPDLEDHFIVLVTDDIEVCNKKTQYIKKKLVISDTEILDFQVLLNADKLIIANSSFSWWAAYLNNKNAQVFVPEYWLGFKIKKEFPCGIIPDKYSKVDF